MKNNRPLKSALRFLYQSFFYLPSLFSKKFHVASEYKFKIIEGRFGFHDRASVNNLGLVISHENIHELDHGVARSADIIISDVFSDEKMRITTTRCFNNQQGSLVTWFDIDDNLPKTIIRNVNGEIVDSVDGHFFSVSGNNKYISMICFKTFGKGLEGYGYYFDSSIDEQKLDKTLRIYDLDNRKFVFEIPIDFYNSAELLKPLGLLDNGFEYFSHTNFSPDSKKMYFLLRSSNKLRNTSQLYVLSLLDWSITKVGTGGMVSHLDWLGNDCVLAFANTETSEKYKYQLFDLISGKPASIDSKFLLKDGHPTVLNDTTFYTDTYPDKSRNQALYKVSSDDEGFDEVQLVAKILSPMRFSGVNRVDLHPRVSRCGKYLSFDSSHLGKVSQVVLYK